MSHIESTKFQDWLVALRREIHEYPELAYEEERTSAKICDVLKFLDIPFKKRVGKTGVVGWLDTGRPGPVLALRADMDALPLDEETDLPFKSRRPGLMHACGHDGHVTMALGAARWLKETGWADKGRGRILFIFQPAEEGGAGSKAMLDDGILDSEPVDAIFAAHMFPEMPVGNVGTTPGACNAAADTIEFRLKGKGGHGAHPEQCRDVILVGSHLVTQLQGLLSREISALEQAVLTIATFHAGSAHNIIPEEAVLEGTLRTFNPDIRSFIIARIREIVKGLEISHKVAVEFILKEGYPMVINNPKVLDYTEKTVKDLIGGKRIHRVEPSMGAEDYSFFCNKWPGVFIKLGCHDPERGFEHGLHSPFFHMDERVLSFGAWIFGELLTRYEV